MEELESIAGVNTIKTTSKNDNFSKFLLSDYIHTFNKLDIPQYGFINKTGKHVISCKYDTANNFIEGLAEVERNGKWGIIDKSGNEVIPCKYDFRFEKSNDKLHPNVINDGLILTRGNSNSGRHFTFYDKSGKIVLE